MILNYNGKITIVYVTLSKFLIWDFNYFSFTYKIVLTNSKLYLHVKVNSLVWK